jgi:hypothetical protein
MGQDGILRPIGNRPSPLVYVAVGRWVARGTLWVPQVANLPHVKRADS